ncbi:MAG: hypothetical protein FJ116_05310 [Deltaproteobacteria bacterium]|nr:hypothetical protein [Deltaproteobacteria bacterium]MBM4316880.1 hypothetical protein [Deltaproteobacteria bacterium]
MKYWLIVLSFFTLSVTEVRAESSLFATDKAAHFGISFIATETGYGIGRKLKLSKVESWLLSAVVVNAIGVVKETAIDRQSDSRDILANVAGSVSAGIFVWTFDF